MKTCGRRYFGMELNLEISKKTNKVINRDVTSAKKNEELRQKFITFAAFDITLSSPPRFHCMKSLAEVRDSVNLRDIFDSCSKHQHFHRTVS